MPTKRRRSKAGLRGLPPANGADRGPGRRPWSARPWLWLFGFPEVLRWGMVVAFRPDVRGVVDGVRRFNKRFLNPAMLCLAGRRHWYAARQEHVGRLLVTALAGGGVARPDGVAAAAGDPAARGASPALPRTGVTASP